MKKIIALIFIASFLSYCGYNLTGRGTVWPKHYRTLYISNFDNQTARANLDLFMIEAFKQEFIKRGRLQISSNLKQADLVLEGKILELEINPVSYDQKAGASSYLAKLKISVMLFAPESGTVFFKADSISREEQLNIDQQDFLSQEDQALQLIAEKFASSIAALILENF